MVTLYQITFYLKFLSLTFKLGQKEKKKIDNIKIIINLPTELKSYLKRYLLYIVLEDCYISAE